MQHFGLMLRYFYKPFWWYHLLFTLIGAFTILRFGHNALVITALFKLTGYASVVMFQYYYKSHVYHYYRNAGYAVRKLYLCSFASDFLFFVAITSIGVYLLSLVHA